jgi:hypothetical protein
VNRPLQFSKRLIGKMVGNWKMVAGKMGSAGQMVLAACRYISSRKQHLSTSPELCCLSHKLRKHQSLIDFQLQFPLRSLEAAETLRVYRTDNKTCISGRKHIKYVFYVYMYSMCNTDQNLVL